MDTSLLDTALLGLDVATIAATVLASWLWFVASGRRIRRVSRFEELNAADLNRIVIAINRSNLLNRRAALASGVAALLVAMRWTMGLLG